MNQEVRHYKDRREADEARELQVKTSQDDLAPKSSLLKRILIFLGIPLIVFILICFSLIDFARRPVSADQSDFQYFEIQKGKSTRAIGRDLKEKGLIRSDLAFLLAVKIENIPLQAGYYKLSPSMEMGEILEKLEKGEVDAFSITIPEGYRNLQIAKLLSEKSEISPYKFIEAATGTEGRLFPDTYVFPNNIEPTKIVRQMKENFEKRTQALNPTEEQLVLASIVEREAKKDDERAKIAAVYKNRADNNMLLQADPTVRYALDSQNYLKNHSIDISFWQSIGKDDYQNLSSSFNTYKQKGYPPAPICNPGLKSIEAALNPEKDFSDYFYFFHDAKGEIHFSKTLAEHQDLIRKFGISGQ